MKLIIISILSVAAFTACSTEIQAHHINALVKICESRGGVSVAWSDMSAWHAKCVNGDTIYHIGDKNRLEPLQK